MANKDKILNLPWQIGREFTVPHHKSGFQNSVTAELKTNPTLRLRLIKSHLGTPN
jgi:hypothetical protein